MKTILIILPDHFSVRNFLYSPFIEQDFAGRDLRIVFLLKDSEKHSGQTENKKNIILEELSDEKTFQTKVRNKILNYLYETLNFRFSSINDLEHIKLKMRIPNELIISKHDVFPWHIRCPFTKSKFVFNCLHGLYNSSLLTDPSAEIIIKKYNPQAVISTDPQSPTARSFYISAKRNGIKTMSYINSWDYLTTDGPVLTAIDEYIGWNERMGFELANLHKSNKPFHNIGPLHFDYSFHSEFIWPREKLFEFLGVPLNQKIITYGVLGARVGMHEPGIAAWLADKIKDLNGHLIIRGHPEDQSIPERYKEALAKPNASICMGKRFDDVLEKSVDDRIVLYSLLAHSSIVICGPTTLTLDALRFDKPVINIGFDGYLELPKNASISNRYEIDHYAPLLGYDGIYYVNNFEELEKALKSSIERPEEQAIGRKKIRENYLEPLDGKASQRLFELLS
jgi:hypothetical protein